MFDKLIDVALSFAETFRFFTVIDEFERGVVLRAGKFSREIGPGFHWLIPFNIERAFTDNVVPRTQNLGAQSLTTKDGKNVVVSGIVTAKIRDIKKAVLEVEGVDHALIDSCYAGIASLVSASTWDEIRSEEFSDKLTAACRKQAFRYGVEITRVQLSDVALSRALRLFMNQ